MVRAICKRMLTELQVRLGAPCMGRRAAHIVPRSPHGPRGDGPRPADIGSYDPQAAGGATWSDLRRSALPKAASYRRASAQIGQVRSRGRMKSSSGAGPALRHRDVGEASAVIGVSNLGAYPVRAGGADVGCDADWTGVQPRAGGTRVGFWRRPVVTPGEQQSGLDPGARCQNTTCYPQVTCRCPQNRATRYKTVECAPEFCPRRAVRWPRSWIRVLRRPD